jgi:hypothetical protein
VIKVHHSTKQHWLCLEFSATITHTDIKRATERVSPILKKMEHGYTLIEIFRGYNRLEVTATQDIGNLTHACYKSCRIWRVVRVSQENGHDPGVVLTHRTRWKRAIPEIEVDDLPTAINAAEEEFEENSCWV